MQSKHNHCCGGRCCKCCPTRPDLPAQLRLAAAAITSTNRRDLRLWLKDGLFTRLLHILRTLHKLSLSPSEATDVCTATAAVLVNILYVATDDKSDLPRSTTLESLTSQISAPDILAAVVQLGMLGPAAAERLTPGKEVHIQHVHSVRILGTPSRGSWPKGPPQFWTPIRVCGHLLTAMFATDAITVNGETDLLERIGDVVRPAVDTGCTATCWRLPWRTLAVRPLLPVTRMGACVDRVLALQPLQLAGC
jgi:hypothetical protein